VRSRRQTGRSLHPNAPELLFVCKDIVDAVDPLLKERRVVCVVVADVVPDAEMLAGVVEDVCAGGDKDIDVAMPDEFDEYVLHTCRDHRARQPHEYRAVRISDHPGPDAE